MFNTSLEHPYRQPSNVSIATTLDSFQHLPPLESVQEVSCSTKKENNNLEHANTGSGEADVAQGNPKSVLGSSRALDVLRVHDSVCSSHSGKSMSEGKVIESATGSATDALMENQQQVVEDAEEAAKYSENKTNGCSDDRFDGVGSNYVMSPHNNFHSGFDQETLQDSGIGSYRTSSQVLPHMPRTDDSVTTEEISTMHSIFMTTADISWPVMCKETLKILEGENESPYVFNGSSLKVENGVLSSGSLLDLELDDCLWDRSLFNKNS